MEAAFAGALGLRLGGPLSYGGRVEQRPSLGDGPRAGRERHRAREPAVEPRRRGGARGRRGDLDGARPMSGALLVCGTHSDAGKSVVTAGLCRWLRRRGVSVAPFKAQNMALNSVVTPGGAEIGRAQAVQAAAAGIEPEAAMNPVLIKPSGERHSQVIVMGKPYADADARSYQELKAQLRPIVERALADLRARYDVVICEGAGSPAEINLRAGDITNMGLARAAGLPVLVVGDIDRGGVFASLFGTLALLEPADQALVAGFVINKFRGDATILAPGLDDLHARTGRPVLGVLPFVEDLWMDVEDSLALEAPRARGAGRRRRRHARRRRPAAALDEQLHRPRRARLRARRARALHALAGRRRARRPRRRARARRRPSRTSRGCAPPGSIARCARGRRRARRSSASAAATRCSAARSTTPSSPARARSTGSACCRCARSFSATRSCAGARARAPGSAARARRAATRSATGASRATAASRCCVADDGEPDGCRDGWTLGTAWHGALEDDALRRALLRAVAAARGRTFVAGTGAFAAQRERRLDALGDLVEQHLDTDAVLALIEHGAPADS